MTRRAALLTHSHHGETPSAVRLACEIASRLGVEIVVSPDEAAKPHLGYGDDVRVRDDATTCCDVVIAFGGDGTTLRALHAALPSSPPVFTVNFGSVGFLRTAEKDAIIEALTAALSGDFATMAIPALRYRTTGGDGVGFNDVVLRPDGHAIAVLAVTADGRSLGEFRGDGLIAATPVGSTGYNLASGGPALAWGVEGYVVSLLAPHTVAHRPFVAGPQHRVTVSNEGSAPVDLIVDGRPATRLAAHDRVTIDYRPSAARLARLPDGGFFRRFDEAFGSRS